MHAAGDAGRRRRHLARVAGEAAAQPPLCPATASVSSPRWLRRGAGLLAAVELVRFRGAVMQEAVPAGTGRMAAMLGLEDAAVEAACREAAQGEVVEAVNYNSPGQVVIAGRYAAVQRAMEAAKARGAKRAVLLPVSVPSHSASCSRLRERLASGWQRCDSARRASATSAPWTRAEHADAG